MKVVYHQVTRTDEESFRLLEIKETNYPCSWHFHPEYQLGLVVKGSGHRVVGDSISPLEPGDVSLLGPNLPHIWNFDHASLERSPEGVHAIVIYFQENFLGEGFFDRPEMKGLRHLLERAAMGLQVGGKSRRQIAALLQGMPGHQGFQRLLDLLQILNLMAVAEEVMPICSAGFVEKLPDLDGERLRKVCDHVQARLGERVSRDEAAALAHLSPGAFSRFFKARTGKTFQDFVTELRIGRACRLLGDVELNVTEVALMCGFSSVASFNRSFRRLKHASPTAYRRSLEALN